MELTNQDRARLRFPLSCFRGLDPTGLRVFLRGWEWYGTPLATGRATPNVFIYNVPSGFPTVQCVAHGGDVAPDDILLNLEDAATRDRVARWMAQVVGLKVGATAPPIRVSGWDHADGRKSRHIKIGDDGLHDYRTLSLPDDIDDTDERQLFDGCLYVDALAMGIAGKRLVEQMV